LSGGVYRALAVVVDGLRGCLLFDGEPDVDEVLSAMTPRPRGKRSLEQRVTIAMATLMLPQRCAIWPLRKAALFFASRLASRLLVGLGVIADNLVNIGLAIEKQTAP